jgi:hypothetical protein
MKIGRGTEVLGENLFQRHFAHHKSHLSRSVLEPGPPRWEASDVMLLPVSTNSCSVVS